MDPDDICSRRKQSQRGVGSRDQRRRRCGCRGASTRVARCWHLRASGSCPALERRGRRRHSRQRSDGILPRRPRRSESLPLRCRQLSDEISIAPQDGLGFRARHLDFHPTRPWVFLTIEAQNRLQLYRRSDVGLEPTPAFSASTLSDGGGVRPGQTASTVHVHPSGQFVYVGNRGASTRRTQRDRCCFRINETTGEPSLIQNVDTRGFTPRTFALDPSGRLLVVGNQNSVSVSEGRCRRSWCPPVSQCSALGVMEHSPS